MALEGGNIFVAETQPAAMQKKNCPAASSAAADDLFLFHLIAFSDSNSKRLHFIHLLLVSKQQKNINAAHSFVDLSLSSQLLKGLYKIIQGEEKMNLWRVRAVHFEGR